MKVSILIPLYNSEKYIKKTILSALNQTWKNKEIIIVDDGSTDNSYTIAKSFESNILKVFRQENQGAPSARNYALEKATGDYIQFLDSDDLMAPNKIEIQLKALAQYNYNKDIIAFCGWIRFRNDVEVDYSKRRVLKLYKNYAPAYKILVQYWLLSFPSIPYHNYLTSRKKITEIGQWNIKLKSHQDTEYFARIITSSEKIIFCNDTIVYYRDVIDSISKSNSLEKVSSEFMTIRIITDLLLEKEKKEIIQFACSLRYTEFIESRYPMNIHMLKKIKDDMRNFKLKFVISHRGLSYKILYFLFGWKLTNQLLKPYNYMKRVLKKSL